jgi:hypothetical protein
MVEQWQCRSLWWDAEDATIVLEGAQVGYLEKQRKCAILEWWSECRPEASDPNVSLPVLDARRTVNHDLEQCSERAKGEEDLATYA